MAGCFTKREQGMARDEGPKWHPIMELEEFAPGQWTMVDQWRKPFAVILLLDIKDERWYRAVTWKQESADRKLLGYYKTLRAAAMHVHQEWNRRGVPHGRANATAEEVARLYTDPWA